MILLRISKGILIILLVIILTMVTVALSIVALLNGRINKSQEIEYYSLLKAIEDANYNIDTTHYEDAILFLVSPERTAEQLNKVKDLIDETIIDNLTIPEQIENKTNVEINTAGDVDTSSTYSNDNIYPIYGSHYSITGYGSKEESEKSLEELKKYPDNVIKCITPYKYILVAKIDNKYTGEYMLRLRLKDNKIIDFEMFR